VTPVRELVEPRPTLVQYDVPGRCQRSGHIVAFALTHPRLFCHLRRVVGQEGDLGCSAVAGGGTEAEIRLAANVAVNGGRNVEDRRDHIRGIRLLFANAVRHEDRCPATYASQGKRARRTGPAVQLSPECFMRRSSARPAEPR
jgi:hypothetical protein